MPFVRSEMIKLRLKSVETLVCGWLPPVGADTKPGDDWFVIVRLPPVCRIPPPPKVPLPVCAVAVKARAQITKKTLRAMCNLYIMRLLLG